ncbi:MAG: TRAP transporter TatT component family protein [bacterium]
MARSRSLPRLHAFVYALLACSLAGGCGRIVGMYTRPLSDDLSRSFLRQRDVELAEQGTPAFLLVLDGLIQHSPENKDLLLAGSQAYGAYGTAFVAAKDPERNKILAAKAKSYGIAALGLQNKAFAKVKDRPYEQFETCLETFRKKDVPFVFQAAASWVGWIQAHASSMEAIADLPKVEGLVRRVLELDETFYYGSGHTFLGALLTVRPPSLGGRPEEAREHFERALQIGQDKFLPAYVMFARQYAMLVYDEDLFFSLLRRVLESPVDTVPELTLINTLAQRQAREMITQAKSEAYFE